MDQYGAVFLLSVWIKWISMVLFQYVCLCFEGFFFFLFSFSCDCGCWVCGLIEAFIKMFVHIQDFEEIQMLTFHLQFRFVCKVRLSRLTNAFCHLFSRSVLSLTPPPPFCYALLMLLWRNCLGNALLTGVILKGLTLRKCVSDVCVCMFYVYEVSDFVDWLDGGLMYMWEEFRNVYLLMAWVWLSWGDPAWLTGH